MPKDLDLGARLRLLRQGRDHSLRDVEREWGINSGYLSQLEQGKISKPSPTTLKKLSDAYGEPLEVLMEWAGYIERDPEGISANRQRALSYLPEDISENELSALKAVLDAMRSGNSATAYQRHARSDLDLTPQRRLEIRSNAIGVLRELDAHRDSRPVDLDQALVVAKLVKAGAIELDLRERERLRDRFKGLVDKVLSDLHGLIRFDTNEVFVKEDLHRLKKRFVIAHELGHGVLQDHRLVFAHLDDRHRLRPEFSDRLEREANQFGIDLLAKGDRLRSEFDDSRPSIDELIRLSAQMDISKQAVARRIAEESKQDCAVAMAWRTKSGQGPLWVDRFRCWSSPSFRARFGWNGFHRPDEELRSALRLAAMGQEVPPMIVADNGENPVELRVESCDAHYSVMLLITPEVSGRRKLFRSVRRAPAAV